MKFVISNNDCDKELENVAEKTVALLWVTLEKPAGGRMMKQFFCASRADAIAKVTEWADKAIKIEVIPK